MPHAERRDDVITVATKYTEKDQIKQIPGSRWDKNAQVWTVPLTWAACIQLRGVFGQELTIGPLLQQWSYDEYTQRVIPATQLRTVITRVNDDLYDSRLYDFQTAGAEFMRVGGSALLGDDMGMGKTPQILAVLKALTTIGEDAFPALVICPNSVKPGWVKQAHQWNIDCNPYVVAGSAKQRRDVLAAAQRDKKALVIINIEAVRLFSRLAPYGSTSLKACRECRAHGEEKIKPPQCEVHLKELNNFGFSSVILDEAHRIKDPSSKQTRAVWAVGHDASVKRRLALTGTPIADNVGDLWSIMHFLAPDEYPTKSRFVDRYALMAWNPFGSMDIVGINPQTKEEFFKILDSRFRRTPKALVLDQLPHVVRATRWVDMSPKQERAYRELEKSLITRLDDGQVMIAPNNLVNATRLLQLSSSYCNVEWVNAPDDCPNHQDEPHLKGKMPCCETHMKCIVTLAEPSTKLDEMENAYDDLGKPVIIAAMSRQLIELAANRFKKRKIPFGMIVGGMNDFDRDLAIRRFVDGYHNIILMTIQAGGTGVDGLQHADTLFCLQRSWSMIENVQLDGRVDRIGSEKHDSVTIVDFVTRNTIEETTQYPRLIEKYERLEEINRDRLRLLRQGATQNDLHTLDAEENRIMNSNLGAPDGMV